MGPAGHEHALDTALPQATAVWSIGWRANERDFRTKLVAGLTGKPLFRVMTRTLSSAESIASRFAGEGLESPFRPSATTFSEFVDSGLMDDTIAELLT